MLQKINGWLVIVIFILILARFVTGTYVRLLTNSNSAEGDQLAFMQLGLDLREQGTLTDGVRNPLYTVFLATIARRDWAYFTEAKLLSMTFGVLTIIAVYLLGCRYFNTFTGLVSAYLLSINTEFIIHSANVLTESLLVLTFVLAWFVMVKALDKDEWRYWAIAGALAGLAYLAKGSGQLLVFAFLISAFFFYRFKILKLKGLWIFLASYALLATPLWIYNTVHFGSPTFNYPMANIMWLDHWREFHHDDLDNLPTLFSYLQTHSLPQVINREWAGLQSLRNSLVKTLWPTRPLQLDQFLLAPVSSYIFTLLALLPFIFWRTTRQYIRQNRSVVSLTVLTVFIFYILFAWYVPIVPLGQRFLLPLIPIIFIALTHPVSLVWQKIKDRLWAKRLLAITIMLIIISEVYFSIGPTRLLFTRNVFAQDRQFNADAAIPLEWLVQRATAPINVAWGPAGKSLPTWAYSNRLNFKLYPPTAYTIPELTQNFVSRDIDFVIVSPDMISRQGGSLKRQFPSDDSRVEITHIPAGWALTYAYRGIPCQWCIFRLLASNPPQHRVNYQVGQAIKLKGYDLKLSQFHPGDTIYLTLHWDTIAPPGKDYTVFTQLLGPDMQLHGQLDHQPINNLWPTSRWQPGDYLADNYDIPINPDTPIGEYQILVGMYDLQGQRQPISQNGRMVADNAIYLTRITIIH